jgi:diadenosine tetraphosphate (Ap4A) HIT family hydrolase
MTASPAAQCFVAASTASRDRYCRAAQSAKTSWPSSPTWHQPRRAAQAARSTWDISWSNHAGTRDLADLTDAEARAVGWWCAQASRALREAAGAEHIYAAVIGDHVPHLHVHLLPRYPGTPREYWWDRVDEWPGARRGTEPEIAELVTILHDYLTAAAQP